MNEALEYERTDVQNIPINMIKFNPDRPRSVLSVKDLRELAQSICRYGVMQPISVKSLPDGKYELISGERRLRASVLAGRKTIPSVVYSFSDMENAVSSIIYDIENGNMNFFEEAEAYKLLLGKYGFTQQEISLKVGKSQPTVANKLRLLKLSPEVKKVILDNNLTERHARVLLCLERESDQLIFLRRINAEQLSGNDAERIMRIELERSGVQRHRRSSRRQYEYVPQDYIGEDNYLNIHDNYKKMVFTVRHAVENMRSEGIMAKAAHFDRGDYMEVVIRVPKKNKDNCMT